MNCENVLELLSPYIDEELSDHERKTIEAHIAECADCRHQLESLTATVMMLRDLGKLDVPPEVSQALHNISTADTGVGKLSKTTAASKPWFALSFVRYLAAAGAVAAIAITFTLSQLTTNMQESSDTLEPALVKTAQQATKDKLADTGRRQSTKNKNSAPEQAGDSDLALSTDTGIEQRGDALTLMSTPQAPSSGNQQTTKVPSGEGDLADQEKLLMGSSKAVEDTANSTELDWPKVLASEKNYDGTGASALLNDLAESTDGLYAVKDATQNQSAAVDEVVKKITARGGSGEAMRKPLDTLLNETKWVALPVYVEKARFKGVDCWLIVIRWGFGADNSALNKTSLYITDLTGWKTLHYESK